MKCSQFSSNQTNQKSSHFDQQKLQEESKKLDDEFVNYLHQAQKNLNEFSKHEKIRIELWLKKLCEVTTNPIWKQNRNLYITILLEMLQNGIVWEPFTHVPPDGPLQRLSKYDLIMPWTKTNQSSYKLSQNSLLGRGASPYTPNKYSSVCSRHHTSTAKK
ncbi:hypothetical protein PPERSA_08185 [Pseudocohnilembus persalinus]|uniref:DUF4485 domain-containing protein n=1 Tax=Pseudocohnilembus persalinus TaxID=266149 RepID=A0A0V0R383_PSEPJ|nr:hypothetical protein PPERSA_08185 [Pseudocohnilembus persalinus]|eukprot:KRX08982.1 hypothetical protein PPERSA_08185 [Pseudocohnilembus persalinus]